MHGMQIHNTGKRVRACIVLHAYVWHIAFRPRERVIDALLLGTPLSSLYQRSNSINPSTRSVLSDIYIYYVEKCICNGANGGEQPLAP